MDKKKDKSPVWRGSLRRKRRIIVGDLGLVTDSSGGGDNRP